MGKNFVYLNVKAVLNTGQNQNCHDLYVSACFLLLKYPLNLFLRAGFSR